LKKTEKNEAVSAAVESHKTQMTESQTSSTTTIDVKAPVRTKSTINITGILTMEIDAEARAKAAKLYVTAM